MGRLGWWRLTYPRHLTMCDMHPCSLSSPPLGFLLLLAYLCLAFFLIVPIRLLLKVRLLPSPSIVVFLRALSCLILYFYFSLMFFSVARLTLSIHMPKTRHSILLLILNLLPPLHLELPLVFIFPISFLQTWIEFPSGVVNLVKFNSLKTQLLEISLSKTPPNFSISFNGSPISPVDNINILGLNINKKMSWKPHITMVAKASSKKLGVLFRLRELFSSSQLLQLYKGLIRL